MSGHFDFRALLLKIEDLLSDQDRHRLHFVLGSDVPRSLRDDLSLGGTLRLLDSLLDKAFIDDEDYDYLIEAFNKISCHDAVKRLLAYQRTRKETDRRSLSLQNILLEDMDEEVDKVATKKLPEEVPLTVRTDIESWLSDETHGEITSTNRVRSVRARPNKYYGNSRWTDLICKMPLNFRERILLVIMIIILTVFVLVQVIRRPPNCVPFHTNTTAVTPLRATNVVLSPSAKWSSNGSTVAGGNDGGNGLNQLRNPFGLYIHDDQTVYVADQYNHRIVAWPLGAKQGQVVAGGREGNGLSDLNWPIDVTVDRSTDTLLICDGANKRVVRWPRRNGRRGELVLSQVNCSGLTMDDCGFLYVSDEEKHEVRRFRVNVGDLQGTRIAGGNEGSDAMNRLNSPGLLFIDRNHSIYVSDRNNGRVVKWIEGKSEGLVVAGGHGRGGEVKKVSNPSGIVVDNMATVYVTDSGNHRVMRWLGEASEGSVVVGGRNFGDAADQLSSPAGLSFDRYGHLYVVDTDNHRVQKFNLLSK